MTRLQGSRRAELAGRREKRPSDNGGQNLVASTAPPDEVEPRQVDVDDGGNGVGGDDGGGRPDDNGGAGAPAPRAKKPFYKRPILMIILAAVILIAIGGGIWYWIYSSGFESTDDAEIQADVTQISPKVSGIISTIPPDIQQNALVKQGQLLVQIDERDYALQIQSAEAALTAAKGKLAQAEAQEKVAEANAASSQADVTTAQANAQVAASDLARYQALDPRGISKQQIDTAQSAVESTKAIVEADQRKADAARAQVQFVATQVETARADIQTAQVALDNSKLQRTYTSLKAPVDGKVTNKTVQVGMYVQAGQVLMSIVPEDVYLIANFKETQLTHMKPGDKVDIHVDAFPDRTYHGVVNSIQKGSGAAFSLLPPENATGNFVKVVQRVPVKIVFDAHENLEGLGPGMSVEPKVYIKSGS